MLNIQGHSTFLIIHFKANQLLYVIIKSRQSLVLSLIKNLLVGGPQRMSSLIHLTLVGATGQLQIIVLTTDRSQIRQPPMP